MEFTRTLLTNPITRPALRNPNGYALRKVKGIIAHWTANTAKGADARAHHNYFNSTNRVASAHWFVDDHSAWQIIPETEVAFNCGDKPVGAYKKTGLAMLKGEPRTQPGISHTPNFYTVSFEMCVNADGDWKKTYANSANLAAMLLLKHELGIHDLYRHYDITGKDCPKMMLTDAAWDAFKTVVAAEFMRITQAGYQVGRVNVDDLNVRAGAGATHEPLFKLGTDERVLVYEKSAGNWARIGENQWVNAKYLDII